MIYLCTMYTIHMDMFYKRLGIEKTLWIGMGSFDFLKNRSFCFVSNEEKNKAVQENPKSLKFFKKFVGAVEFTNNTYRWCLWIED